MGNIILFPGYSQKAPQPEGPLGTHEAPVIGSAIRGGDASVGEIRNHLARITQTAEQPTQPLVPNPVSAAVASNVIKLTGPDYAHGGVETSQSTRPQQAGGFVDAQKAA